ncbi:ATP-binding protein [Streptomyces roseicoloratus]|uniref:ATP-binding protein n=1 Tax=Streptomyces roseicoloratus TaxID=2508722 RepID=A0ABY9RWK2_9ACTN|nr:ATP-binding protein [Streptomyces roseicoloratus]WMX45599.1 ATP-binding protein [Streptomyces roseicoloratus]
MNEESARLLAPVRQFGIQLSATPRGARLARLLAVEQLRSWGLEAVADATAQIVAELAANAVTHGRVPGRDFRLALVANGAVLRIEVTDTRADRLPRRERRDGAESGRGLVLVEALSRDWGVRLGPTPRKTIWSEVPLR